MKGGLILLCLVVCQFISIYLTYTHRIELNYPCMLLPSQCDGVRTIHCDTVPISETIDRNHISIILRLGIVDSWQTVTSRIVTISSSIHPLRTYILFVYQHTIPTWLLSYATKFPLYWSGFLSEIIERDIDISSSDLTNLTFHLHPSNHLPDIIWAHIYIQSFGDRLWFHILLFMLFVYGLLLYIFVYTAYLTYRPTQ